MLVLTEMQVQELTHTHTHTYTHTDRDWESEWKSECGAVCVYDDVCVLYVYVWFPIVAA